MPVSTIPPTFVEQVKDALEHLQDLVYLRGHPVAKTLGIAEATRDIGGARALRQRLLDAIDEVKPVGSASAGGRQHRIRLILDLRYVEGLPYREVMSELGLSQSQYHRDQRAALEAVATVLWDTSRPADRGGAFGEVADENGDRYPELDAIAGASEELVDLSEVVCGVGDVIRGLAVKRQVGIDADVPAPGVVLPSHRAILRQLFISAAQYALNASSGGRLTLAYAVAPGQLCLLVAFRGQLSLTDLQTPEAQEHLAIVRQSCHLLAGTTELTEAPGELVVTIRLSDRRRTLLVIDDNHDLVRLVTRYVADQGYAVLHAERVSDGLRLAQGVRPNMILLDVMLPGQDGWDALQALRHHPDTAAIPIIVCTVLGEADLALALGANAFIRKPVTRPALLQVLHRLGTRLPRPEASDPVSSRSPAAARSPQTGGR
jgi:CheY-like chemotaxis protein